MFCIDFSGVSAEAIARQIRETDDGYLLGQLRRAAKNLLYHTLNSPAMNGYSSNTRIVTITPWWQPALRTITWVFAGLTAAGLIGLTACYLLGAAKKRKGGKTA